MNQISYGEKSIAAVMSTAAVSVGAELPGLPVVPRPQKDAAIVVLADGLGWKWLQKRRSYTPFLSSAGVHSQEISAAFPSTTATGTTTVVTGLPPGQHGIVGYTAYDPHRRRVFNSLSWAQGPHPEKWQPKPGIMEKCAAQHISSAVIAPGFFAGSGLSRATLRDGHMYAADEAADRLPALYEAYRAGHKLIYLYWPEIDKSAHMHGTDSFAALAALEDFDAAMKAIHQEMPASVSIDITADHGMVDIANNQRFLLPEYPQLTQGVRAVAGEMRCLQLFGDNPAEIKARWQDYFGDKAVIYLREEAIESGWFGPVSAAVRPRIGEVVVAFSQLCGVIDPHSLPSLVAGLMGQHGSITAAEMRVPWLNYEGAK